MPIKHDFYQESLAMHRQSHGELDIVPVVPLTTRDELSRAYTPGVAEPCRAIIADRSAAFDLTLKGHTIAIVTDGSAVLGLGNIGGLAAMPVMAGKAALVARFTHGHAGQFSGIHAFPISLATQNSGLIVQTVKLIAVNFAAIMLEDISAPRCFEIERRLAAELDIPVMHDDQHGTATVVLAGITNAMRAVGKEPGAVRVVVVGAGAAGTAIASLLFESGYRRLTVVDKCGIIAGGIPGLNKYQAELARRVNPEGTRGTLAEAMVGADVFVGVSAPGIVTADMVRTMAPGAIVFALANPVPEITTDEARAGGAAVVASGRSDDPNQVNNLLAFPGIFCALVNGRRRRFLPEMRVAAARAIAGLVEKPAVDNILPDPLDPRVMEAVATAVSGVPD